MTIIISIVCMIVVNIIAGIRLSFAIVLINTTTNAATNITIGIISIAAPILTDAGRVVGAVSIATATHRHTLDGLNAFRPALLECATRIGAEAQSWQSPSVPS